MKTVFVTGATSGIGLAIVNHLVQKGYRVYGTGRDPGKHQDQVSCKLLPLDVTSGDSVTRCIETLMTLTPQVDAVVNNAGIGVCGSAEETSEDQAIRQLETNFWGTVRVTRALLPVMRKQRSGKIITIGSLAGLIGVPYQSYYSASKHALEGFFKSLRLELHAFGISVSVIEPGFFRSNLHNAFEFAEPAIHDYDKMRTRALHVFEKSIEEGKTPEPVAQIVEKILTARKPRFSYPVGTNTLLAPFVQHYQRDLYEFIMRRKFGLSE